MNHSAASHANYVSTIFVTLMRNSLEDKRFIDEHIRETRRVQITSTQQTQQKSYQSKKVLSTNAGCRLSIIQLKSNTGAIGKCYNAAIFKGFSWKFTNG